MMAMAGLFFYPHMLEKLLDEELSFLEDFHNPVCASEILFSDYDNMPLMQENKMSHVRLGQFPLLSYEYLIDNQPELSEKDNFELRKGAGDIYCMGGRLFGKTLFVEKVDLCIDMIVMPGSLVGFASYDALHIKGVLETTVRIVEHHPFIKLFKERINRNPYLIQLKNGWNLISVNMNITGKKPGAQFFQKHFDKLYIEEASFETKDVYEQRRDSISEDGCVFRVAGMTNFTQHTPCGQMFYNLSNKAWVLNLPQYVNPKWDEKAKVKALKDFGGEQSIGYRIFIKGEVVEEGVSVFDMPRVRKNYVEGRLTKTFEIRKENFPYFEQLIVIEKPKNAEVTYVCSDIGESAATEIIVIFKIKDRYRLVYNVTLHNLTDKEQFKLFKWLVMKLEANFIALDCTDGTGRAIYRSLEEVPEIKKGNLVWVGFNEKIPVGFAKDDKDNTIYKNGKATYVEEYVSEFSIKHLQVLLYSELMEIPAEDYKFDMQVNNIRAMQSGTRIKYECAIKEDHYFQAFQTFSIAHWFNEFNLINPISIKKFCKTGF